MQRTIRIHYSLEVLRGGSMIQYNAEHYPSLADARVAARRLGEYVEIRKVRTTVARELVERVEGDA